MKLQLPHSARPDVFTGFSLLLALTGGMTWFIWLVTTSSVMAPMKAPTQIEQSQTAVPQVIPPQPIAKTAPTQTTIVTPLKPPVSQAPTLEPPVKQPVFEQPTRVYWLQARGQTIELVPVTLARSPHHSENAALTEALDYLFSHPQLDRLDSTIPAQTRLLGLQIKSDGIHLNLSKDFTQGGGSTSMTYRVAQVLYTVTSLDPQAKVYLSVEGKLLNEDNPLGGEGLLLQQPLTRQSFVQEFLSKE